MTWETRKCYTRRLAQGHLQKLIGKGLDIGGGNDAFRPLAGNCRVWDKKSGDGDATTLNGVESEEFDYVYSSHCLEHLGCPIDALRRWIDILKPEGFLYLALPDFDLYEGGQRIRNKYHKCAFSIHRGTDGRIPLYNVLEIIAGELRQKSRVLYLALCDDHYDYELGRDIDQTRMGAVCHIEVLLQKYASGPC